MSGPTGESATTDFGFETVALGDKQARVDDVFATVARRYDIMNDMMSGGLHRAWKNAFVGELCLPRAARRFDLLDVAGGTGDIAFRALKRGGHGVGVTLLDINGPMLEVARERAEERGLSDRIEVVQGNAESLPFPDASFDAVTIAFGIRNVPRVPLALSEFRRVLKIGGRFSCLEFSKVEMPGLGRLYDLYSFNAIPKIGEWVAGDGEPYRYLVESIRRFPDGPDFAEMIRAAGFDRVSFTPLTGGVAAIHRGWKL
jgi:demethylmenaquinone methyltransferase/2-methoxy-6-polyprenyl-1,4-benzoquinol methylase